VGTFKKEDFAIGDYIYWKRESGNYEVTRITEMGPYRKLTTRVWGYWAIKSLVKLPETIEEFEALEKEEDRKFIEIEAIDGFLTFNKRIVYVNDSCGFEKKLLNLDNYESETIAKINELLEKKPNLEDILGVLIPNISKMIKESLIIGK